MWQAIKDQVRGRYASFEHEIQKWRDGYTTSGGRIYCGKGCHNCCSLAVTSTFAEALLVAGALEERHARPLQAYVARLRENLGEVSDLKSYLRMHRKKLGFCPFLDADGSCGVYAVRPFSCRSLLSTRPSGWCGADFGELHPLEKEAFLSSLDRSVVAFPAHYVAATRDLGQELESQIAWSMTDRFGCSLSGNLPFLVALEREYRLSELICRGAEEIRHLLDREGLNSPFLILFNP